MGIRFWWAKATGKADGPLRRCPTCDGFFDKDAGHPTGGSEQACSPQCAEEHARLIAW